MSILLFFMIGHFIDAPVIYWAIFSIYLTFKLIIYFSKFVIAVVDNYEEENR